MSLSWNTATMADLYWKQGHREQALAIYRELAMQRPDDTAITARLAWMERALGGSEMSFREHLQYVVDSVPGAASASVMGFDGIVIDTYESPDNSFDTATILVEYAAVAAQLGQSASRVPNAGAFHDVVIQAENVSCLIRPVTGEYIMTMLVRPTAVTGRARFLMRLAAPAIAKELA